MQRRRERGGCGSEGRQARRKLDVAAVARLRELRRELQGSSVSLTFTIVTTATAAAATVSTLSSRLANPTAASAFLTTPSYIASVTSIVSLPVATYVPPPQSVSQLFHGPAPRSPLHRLAVRRRHPRHQRQRKPTSEPLSSLS